MVREDGIWSVDGIWYKGCSIQSIVLWRFHVQMRVQECGTSGLSFLKINVEVSGGGRYRNGDKPKNEKP